MVAIHRTHHAHTWLSWSEPCCDNVIFCCGRMSYCVFMCPASAAGPFYFIFASLQGVHHGVKPALASDIDKTSVVLNVFVVPGRAPLLLSKPMLQALGGRLDFAEASLELAR